MSHDVKQEAADSLTSTEERSHQAPGPSPAGLSPMMASSGLSAPMLARKIQRRAGARAGDRVIQRAPSPTATGDKLIVELENCINGAEWKWIRQRVYPKESAAGVQRAKDRHAGKAPDLTGLGSLKTLEHFAAAVKDVQGKWDKLSPKQRLAALAKAANAELAGVGVPAFLDFRAEDMAPRGGFQPGTWHFLLQKSLLESGKLSDEDAGELCNVTLHESRHAEQHFLAARYSAGVNGTKAADLASEQGIPMVIATQAEAKKLDPKADAAVTALAGKMYQSMVTDGAANQDISNAVDFKPMALRRSEALVALKDLRTDRKSASALAKGQAALKALQDAIADVEAKYSGYRNIPHEADAHEVGDAAEQAFKGWT